MKGFIGCTERVAEIPGAWQVGMLILCRKVLRRLDLEINIRRACLEMGISVGTAYEGAREVEKRLTYSAQAQARNTIREFELKNRKLKRENQELTFRAEMAEYERDHAGSRVRGIRQQFTDAYKAFVLEKAKEHGLNLCDAGRILGIAGESLKKFSRPGRQRPVDSMPEELPENVRLAINAYLREKETRRGPKSVKAFCKRHHALLESLGLNYRQFTAWLLHLGISTPKGLFLRNNGMDKIIRFKPQMVWGTDGKRMQIIIGGEIFTWVWQCLIDYKTTVIVGGLIGAHETTENLLEAIRLAGEKTGILPLAIVMDNRLSENLPAIRPYLKEHGIEIVKTFPGNPKSNGITEGNFAVFERWCGGRIEIQGNTPQELSRSIAQAVVEIFTQMRNHSPRKSLSFKTAMEIAQETPPADPKETETIRKVIRAIAERQKDKETDPAVSAEKKSRNRAGRAGNPSTGSGHLPQPSAISGVHR